MGITAAQQKAENHYYSQKNRNPKEREQKIR